uniref:Heterokaryon incompatibility domain-containing protein n=1 Tax=Bionectria ochroleuca TaxID=29856 RepID=A0A0B7JVP0_BIOOC
MRQSRTVKQALKNLFPRSRAKSNAAEAKAKLPISGSSTTLNCSAYSEKFETLSKTLSTEPNRSDKYSVLKLNDTLSVSIGDSFEESPDGRVEKTDEFEYGNIRHPKLIRLLLILPSSDQAEALETIMFHAELDEVPFQALSHTSVEKGRITLMHCNGHSLAVEESLYRALKDIRNLAEPHTFSIVWAEAVCINQSDIKDREDHLRLVRDIFTSAHVTLAHLGGTEDQSAKVFQTMDMLHEACKIDEFRERLEQDEIDMSSLEHLCIEDTKLDIPFENRLELTRLFSHHWFERIWNWQEVGLARKVCLMYGGALRPWGYFADTAWCMYQLRWETSVGDECIEEDMSREDLKHYHILHLDEHRDGALKGKTYSLLSLLTESRHFTAAHPLDRVFALYSHLGNSRERDIVQAFFDYDLPRLAMYLNITLNCILSHRTLDALQLAHNNITGEWPSFVPDLSRKDGMRMLGSRNGRRTWEYQASGDTAPQMAILNSWGQTREGIPYFNDDVYISLKGLAVDEISVVGTEMKGPTLGAAPYLADWVNKILMVNGERFYTTPELKRAKEMLLASMKKGHNGTSKTNGAVTTNGESRVRNTFSPSLIEALKKLDLDSNEEVEPMSVLPKDRPYTAGNTTDFDAFWRTLIKNRDENGCVPVASMAVTHFQPWFKAMSNTVSHMLEALAHGQSEGSSTGPRAEPLFNDLVHMSCNGTRMMRTAQMRLIGTVPRTTKPGDLVCVLYGGQTPFILRKSERRPGMFRLVGDCYVHSLMDGEALRMGLEERKFEIY